MDWRGRYGAEQYYDDDLVKFALETCFPIERSKTKLICAALTGILSANTGSHSTTPNCIFCTHSHEDIVRTGQIASSFIHSLTRKALSHHCYKDTA